MFNFWDQLTTMYAPSKSFRHFFSSVPCSTPSLSSKFRQAPLHCYCCPWRLSHGSGIGKTLGSSAATVQHYHQEPLCDSLHGAKSQLPFMTPSVLDLQLFLRLNLNIFWPLTVSSLICFLHASKTSITWVTLLLPHSVASVKYNHGCL